MKFIDIHSHIAWDIDDGMDTKEHAIEALKSATNDGIKRIISTPHFVPGSQEKNEVELMQKRMHELKELGKQYSIEIYTGCELFLNDSYLDMIQKGLVCPLANSSYLLCEYDVRKDITHNPDANDKLYEISVRNYTPVIAHVERYFHNEIDLAMVREWVENGYVIQVNRSSLVGIHGKQIKKNALKLINEGLVHVVASDAHRAKGARVEILSDAYEIVKEIVGQNNADLLFYRNPMHILQNEEIENMEVIKRKSWLHRLMRR